MFGTFRLHHILLAVSIRLLLGFLKIKLFKIKETSLIQYEMLPHEMFKYKKYYHYGQTNKQWNYHNSQQCN